MTALHHTCMKLMWRSISPDEEAWMGGHAVPDADPAFTTTLRYQPREVLKSTVVVEYIRYDLAYIYERNQGISQNINGKWTVSIKRFSCLINTSKAFTVQVTITHIHTALLYTWLSLSYIIHPLQAQSEEPGIKPSAFCLVDLLNVLSPQYYHCQGYTILQYLSIHCMWELDVFSLQFVSLWA